MIQPYVFIDFDYMCMDCGSTLWKKHYNGPELVVECKHFGCHLADREMIVQRTKLQLEYRYPNLYDEDE